MSTLKNIKQKRQQVKKDFTVDKLLKKYIHTLDMHISAQLQ